MSAMVDFYTVSERDMDVLFLNSFVCDDGFLDVFLSKAGIASKSKSVISVELSKSDAKFGESDITVIAEIDGRKTGLLIEDKIDAIAMPEQSQRYSERGKIGVKNKDYEDFHVFIVAPKKYYEQNEEAKKYENYVSYEECKAYFASKSSRENQLKIQQIEQAIEKVKHRGSENFDENRNLFLRQYLEYQKEYFPNLECTNDPETSGTGKWTYFRVNPRNSLVRHKTESGFIDLTFYNTRNKQVYFDAVEKYIAKMGFEDVKSVLTGKSMSFRMTVPFIDFDKPFEDCDKDDLNKCFEACEKLTELAKVINYFAEICQK